MKKKYRFLKIFLTLVILVFLLNFSLKRFNNQPLDKVEVQMLQKEDVKFINERDIKQIIQKNTPSNKVGDLSISQLEQDISSLPMIDSANVFLELNGGLNLHIAQKVPIFRLKNGKKEVYINEKGEEFPLSKAYSHQCMLIMGKVNEEEYPQVIDLVKNINADEFSKNFFVGVEKLGKNYFLLTNDGNYRVELGELENIDFKIKGFKTFVEKYLIYQSPQKYSKISLKYDNQIVTTLR